MKNFYLRCLCAAALVLIASCAEMDPLEFKVDKPLSIIEQEEIDAYENLLFYVDTTSNPNFHLGSQIAMSRYLEGGTLNRLLKDNFQEIIFSTGMQHADIVQQDGSMLYGNLNRSLALASDNGFSVFGNSLVWHRNQNSNYLNSLLEPVTISIPPVSNLIDKTGIFDGNLDEYTVSGSGSDVSIVDGEGFNEGQAIQLKSGTGASQAIDLQLTTPEIPVSAGAEYQVIFHIRSSTEGMGNVSFEGLTDNEPLLDYNGDEEATESFITNRFWKEISFTVNDVTAENMKLHFNLGYEPNVTYYIDVSTLYVYDINDDGSSGGGGSSSGAGDKIWLEAECGDVGSKWVFVEDATASEGTYAMIEKPTASAGSPVTTPDGLISFDFKVQSSGNFKMWARVGAEILNGADDSFYFRIDQNPWVTFNGVINDTNLKWYNISSANLNPDVDHTITVSYREDGAKFDKLYITNDNETPEDLGGTANNCGGIVIVNERSDEEKEFIISNELNKWITGIVTTSSEVVNAWNVVNEPMDDVNITELKTSGGANTEAGVFYWQDYLGKDYAVDAFNWASQNTKSGDLLFISDYGLESNLDKCRGLLQYINYIETQGARVDGIATKMNINTSSDRDQIKTMFDLLAATGKMIAISDFSVDVLDQDRSPEALKAQADLYQYVIETYSTSVPMSQRYGISLRDVVDDATPNENFGLWDARQGIERPYSRKPAYQGFANGLEKL